MTVRFSLLSAVILAVAGVVLYAMIFRTTTTLSESNLRRATAMVVNLVETLAEVTVRSTLKASAERAYDLVVDAYDRCQSGQMTETQALRRVFEELASLRIGETGYAYILNAGGYMEYHPSPHLRGKYPPRENSPIDLQLQLKDNYIEYDWRNPEEQAPEQKALYQVHFKPWNWIITVTSYRKEFDALVKPDLFRDQVLALKFGKAGYAYIIHEDGTAIVHPRITGNPLKATGDPQLVALHKTMDEKREGSTIYSWRNPDDSRPVKKVAFFKWLPRFHWYAVCTYPLSELFEPSYSAGLMILLSILAAVLLSALLTVPLAASITRPLEALAARLDQGTGGDFTVRMPVASEDEIGRLADHFNRFMDGLQASRDGLAASIEERARAEAARARLAAIMEQLSEHVMLTDTRRAIVYVNPAFERVTGYAAEEVLGRKPSILASGRQDAAFFAAIVDTLQKGKSWEGRIINRRKDGVDFVQEGTITPIRDESGAVVNYVSVSRDITREVEQELRQRQSQKLEAVGTLAGGIAHDFNNILTAMLGFAELVETGLAPDHPLQEYVREIVRAGTRARDLVSKILTFSRQSTREMRPVRMDSLVKDALGLLRATIPSTIGIVQDIETGIPPLLADPTEVHQMVMNLCTNAAQAIGERPGTIWVDLRRIAGEDAAASSDVRVWVELRVEDDGVGMSDQVVARMFEPFFTTKEAGKGTGIGLPVVHGIVSQMHGEIKVESVPGRGTTIRVLLPLREGPTVETPDPRADLPRGRGERILIVDDEDGVRTVGARILESLGYRVTAVGGAAEALEAVRESSEAFQLILTDHTMPEMAGVELARRLSRVAPSVPVVLMTGRLSNEMEAQAFEAGVMRVLSKPFRRGEMALAVRQVLDAAEGRDAG